MESRTWWTSSRRLVTVFVAAILGVSGAVVMRPAGAQAAPYTPVPTSRDPEIGPFYMKNYHSGKCLDVPGQSMNNNVLLDQWTCVNQTNVKWSLRFAGWQMSSQSVWASFRIVNNHSGKCLTVPRGTRATNGDRLSQTTCQSYNGDIDLGGRDVWWWLVMDGIPMLQNLASLECIDVAGASMSNGAPVVNWTCLRGDRPTNRGWNMVRA